MLFLVVSIWFIFIIIGIDIRRWRETLARRDDPIDTICQEVQFLAGLRCVEKWSALHLRDTPPEPGCKLSLAGDNASEIFLCHWNYDTFWIHFIGAPGIIRNFPLMISSTTRDREDLLGICHCNWQQTSESTIVRPRGKCSQSLDWIGFATNLLPTKSGRVGETGLLAGWPPTKLPSFFVPRWLELHHRAGTSVGTWGHLCTSAPALHSDDDMTEKITHPFPFKFCVRESLLYRVQFFFVLLFFFLAVVFEDLLRRNIKLPVDKVQFIEYVSVLLLTRKVHSLFHWGREDQPHFKILFFYTVKCVELSGQFQKIWQLFAVLMCLSLF